MPILSNYTIRRMASGTRPPPSVVSEEGGGGDRGAPTSVWYFFFDLQRLDFFELTKQTPFVQLRTPFGLLFLLC